MGTKYFITDVDGVIFDRMEVYSSAFVKVMRPLGISEELLRSRYRGTLGTPIQLQIKGAAADFGAVIGEEDLNKMVEDFWEICAKYPTKLFSGVKETLDKIKNRGIFLMASSGSKTGDLAKFFKKYELPYDFFLGSDTILKGDEHIEIFADHFSAGKKDFCRQAAFIGDGTTDMQIAARNGIFGIGITNTISAEALLDAGAQAIISDIGQVFEHLQQ